MNEVGTFPLSFPLAACLFGRRRASLRSRIARGTGRASAVISSLLPLRCTFVEPLCRPRICAAARGDLRHPSDDTFPLRLFDGCLSTAGGAAEGTAPFFLLALNPRRHHREGACCA